MKDLEKKIEAVLFYENEPVEIRRLSKILSAEEESIKEALKNLSVSLEGRGVSLVINDKEAALSTAPEMTGLIEELARDEMKREIGKAGLETLAIILYNGPVSRREVDYIRGVNSTFVIRNLSTRGLIERVEDTGERAIKYKPSLSLLLHLGLKSTDELPNLSEFKTRISEIK